MRNGGIERRVARIGFHLTVNIYPGMPVAFREKTQFTIYRVAYLYSGAGAGAE